MLCGIDEAGRGPLAGPVCAAAVVLPDDFPVDMLADSKKLKPQQREEARRIITKMSPAWGVAWATHVEIDSINILQASLLAMSRAFACLLEDGTGQWPDKLETETAFGKGFAYSNTQEIRILPRSTRSFTEKAEKDIKSPCSSVTSVVNYSSRTVTFPPGLSAIVDGLHIPVLPIPCTPLVKADDKIPEVMAASILAKTARDQLMEYYSRLYPQYGYERHKGYPTKEHRRLVQQYGPSAIQRHTFHCE